MDHQNWCHHDKISKLSKGVNKKEVSIIYHLNAWLVFSRFKTKKLDRVTSRNINQQKQLDVEVAKDILDIPRMFDLLFH